MDRIRRNIAQDNRDAAETFCAELVREAKSLRTSPFRGHAVPRKRGVHKLVHGNYLIFYKIDEANRTVEILRFWHAARDQRWLRLREENPAYALAKPAA